jgi:hypothetical protein
MPSIASGIVSMSSNIPVSPLFILDDKQEIKQVALGDPKSTRNIEQTR